MSVFDLAISGRRALDEDAALNPLRIEDIPLSAWQGSADALKGLLRPSAAAGRTLMMAGAPVAMAVDKVRTAARDVGYAVDVAKASAMGVPLQTPELAPITDAQDWYFRNVVDDLGSDAVDAWTPSPEAMGSAAKAINVGSNVVGTLPQLFGMPSVFLAQSGMDPATELVRQGVDSDTAAVVGGINLAANAIGLRLPAAWGTTLTQRLATGAGSNLGLGIAADAGSATALEEAGYTVQAKGYDAGDPYARGLDVLMGLAFGYKAHIDAPRLLTPSQRDAVLTARNNDHLHRQTMPGDPTNPRAAMAHSNALSTAIGQVLRGESVNIADAINPADFTLRAELRPAADSAAGPTFDDAVQRVLRDEGGFVDDPVDRGGATNFGISSRANPDVDVRNLTREGAVQIYRERYWNAIDADALPPALRGVAFDAAVNHGVGWTRKALRQAGGDVEAFIALRERHYNGIVARDPEQGRFLEGWMARLERYRSEAPPRPAEAPPAPRFDGPEAGRIIDQRLATLEELSGQGRLPREDMAALMREDAELVAVLRDHEQIESSGLVTADPRARLSPEEIDIATARRVEIRQAMEQHRAAGNYESQLAQLRRRLDRIDSDADLVRLAERLAGLDDAPARAPRQLEGEGAARPADADATPAARPAQPPAFAAFGEGSLDVRPGQAAPSALPGAGTAAADRLATTGTASRAGQQGAPSGAAEGARADGGAGQGEAAGARPAPAEGGALDEALRVATENPGLQVIDGFDADGNPRYRAASEVLADIEAERAREANDAQAFPAAVSCFLRMGG